MAPEDFFVKQKIKEVTDLIILYPLYYLEHPVYKCKLLPPLLDIFIFVATLDCVIQLSCVNPALQEC